MNIKDLIYNNQNILETLFCLKDYDLIVINENTRLINKYSPISSLYYYFPLLKDFFNDLFKDSLYISYQIKEEYINDYLHYTIILLNNELFDNFKFVYEFIFYIKINIIETDKNNIFNINLSYEKKENIIDNPLILMITNIIYNYLETSHIEYIKNKILLNRLKPLLLTHHSLELNITEQSP